MASSNTPKTMSSRLMTMKFMQRSATKKPSEPSTPDGPPSKRVRLSNGRSAPGTPATPSDQEVLQAALAAEEKKREDALQKAAEQAGETKWVLSFKDPQDDARQPMMQVVRAGFAAIDAEDDDSDDEVRPARLQFGGGVKKDKRDKTDDSGSDSEDRDDGSSEVDSDDPMAELIRETKRELAAKAKDARQAQKEEAARKSSVPKHIHEDMDLSQLSSLSGGGTGTPSRGPVHNDVECYNCHQKGHRSRDCPRGKGSRGFTPRGRGGKGQGFGGRR